MGRQDGGGKDAHETAAPAVRPPGLTAPLQYWTCFEAVAVGALHTVHVQWQDTMTGRSGAVTSSLVFHDGARRPDQGC